MPRKSEITDNPIRILRLGERKTLEEFAGECHIHLQAVYLNEMGMYPTILPSIMRVMKSSYGLSETEAEEDYQSYVLASRYNFGEEHVPYELGEPSVSVSSIRVFRGSLDISTAFGFAKKICINPTLIRNVEMGRLEDFPGHLNFALRDIQLSPSDITELEYRHQEFFHSGVRARTRRAS